MNVYLVRTRLHCLISMEIQRQLNRNRPYIAIFLYQKSRDEDDSAVYETYESLRSGAVKSYDIVGQDGIFSNTLVLVKVLRRIKRHHGHAFLAVVDSLPVAIALRLTRGPGLQTFDDGSININPTSRYFSAEALPGRGWRRWIARLLFPQGHAKWMRARSTHHFTVFPGRENIVPASKVEPLEIDWEKLLHRDDLGPLKGDIATVVLGTPHEDYPDPDASRAAARRLAGEADLYIRHPREGNWLVSPATCSLKSPAEAALRYLALRQPVRVFHFDSTTGYVLRDHPGLEMINVVEPDTRQIVPEIRCNGSER